MFPFFDKLRQENRRLKEELSLLRGQRSTKNTIVDLRDGIVIVDRDNRIEYINSPFARILGISRDHYTGKHVSHFDRLLGRERVVAFLCSQMQEISREIQRPVTINNPKTNSPLSYLVKVRQVGESIQILFEDHTVEQFVEDLFKRYVSPSVVEQLKQEKHDPFAASLKDMTVLFADLRSFSSAIENMPPQQVRVMVNDFLSAMVDIVNRHQGTLDKFIGDGLMVLFGAPIAMTDHGLRAVLAAADMQREHRELRILWKSLGFPDIPLGIGINSGKMIVGNIGSAYRMEYTALGHEVNVTSRVCDEAKGDEILVTQSTYTRIGNHFTTGSSRSMRIAGIQEVVEVYPVVWQRGGG